MKIEPYLDEPNNELWELLLLADPSKKRVKNYISESEIFVALSENRGIGIAVLSVNADEFELKNIAVQPSSQGKGIAKALVSVVADRAKELGAECLLVGTGNSSLDQLGLYQKCGFRMFAVKHNFFADYDPPIFENGIRCLDLVCLKLEL